MSLDPYAAPSANLVPESRPGETGISQQVLRLLAGTKPWVRFLSVLIFIGAGLMVLLAVVLFVVGGSGFTAGSEIGMFTGGLGTAFAIFYGLLALLYIYPAVKLWKYATYIGQLLNSGSTLDLEAALDQQRAFWKFTGIIALIFVVLYGLIIGGGLLAGAATVS